MSHENHKLKLGALTALVIGSMIGGGIFSLPQNMASGAEVGAILIGWGITAIGMLMLAFVFQNLANRKPELDDGVYAYAKAASPPLSRRRPRPVGRGSPRTWPPWAGDRDRKSVV